MVVNFKPVPTNPIPANFNGSKASDNYSPLQSPPFAYMDGIPSPVIFSVSEQFQHAPIVAEEFQLGSPAFPYPPLHSCTPQPPPFGPAPPFPMPLDSHSPLFSLHYGNPGITFGSSPPSKFYSKGVGAEHVLYSTAPQQQFKPPCYEDQWQYQSVIVPITVYPLSYLPNLNDPMLCHANQPAPQWVYQPLPTCNQLMVEPTSVQSFGETTSSTKEAVSELNYFTEPSDTTVTSPSSRKRNSTWKKSSGSSKTRVRSASVSPSFLQKYCSFCKSNRETKEWYESHVLKSKDGVTCCPILRKYVCPKCEATGDNAHTLKYCPKKWSLDRRCRSKSLCCK